MAARRCALPPTSLQPPVMELEADTGIGGSPACPVWGLGGLSPPLNSGEDEKGPLWVNASTPALLQESFH